VRAQIDYEWVCDTYGVANADLCVQVVSEMYSADSPKTISGVTYPPNMLHERAGVINDGCVEYALDRVVCRTEKIGNTKEYVWAALFNAPTELDIHYGNMALSQ